LKRGRLRTFLVCIAASAALTVACAIRGNQVGGVSDFPFEVRYASDGDVVTLTFEKRGVAKMRIHGQEVAYGKIESTDVGLLAELLGSEDLKRELQGLARETGTVRRSGESVVVLYSSGIEFGSIESRKPRQAPVAVPLENLDRIPNEVRSLVSTIDRLAARAFGTEYKRILFVEKLPARS